MAHQGQSLAEQMQALQRRVDRRERRRDMQRQERAVGGDYDGAALAPSSARDTYGDGPARTAPKRRAPNATGGLPLGSAAAAVAAAGQLAGPVLQRCALCNASFTSEREMAQHLEGAAHRKAVEQQRAEAERRQRLGAYADMAASAVEQAAWQQGGSQSRQPSVPAGRGGGPPVHPTRQGRLAGGSGNGQQQQQQGARGQGRGRGGMPAAAGGPSHPHPPRHLTSHQEMLRQARGEDKQPLDIGGWVPPTVPQTLVPPPAVAAGAGVQQAQQPQQQAHAAGPAVQARAAAAAGGKAGEQEGLEEREEPLLGGLLAYSDDEEEEEEEQGAMKARRGDEAAGAVAGTKQQQRGAAQSGSGADDSSSDSEGGGDGKQQQVSFFTF